MTPMRLCHLIAVTILAGCRVEGAGSDSVRGEPAVASQADSATLPPQNVDTLRGVALDSSAAPTATPAELNELRAHLIIPVAGVRPADLSDNFAAARAGHAHEALDIPAPLGTAVVSAVDGRLLKLHSSAAGGLMIYTADSSDKFILMYAHLDRYAGGLTVGEVLRTGQLLGYVGTTGNAPRGTPHLHFAVARGVPSRQWWKGVPVNPYPLLVP
ncbi:MAG: M23 family metallopeptidase [Gemmatimonadaceae bacterium]